MSQAGAWNQSGLDVPSLQKTTQPDTLKHANWPPELNALQPTPNSLKSKPGTYPRWFPDACLPLFGCLSLC